MHPLNSFSGFSTWPQNYRVSKSAIHFANNEAFAFKKVLQNSLRSEKRTLPI
jgi:hypothetical protein